MQRYIYYLTIITCILFISTCYTPDYKPEDTIIPPLEAQSNDSICDAIMDITGYGNEFNADIRYTIGDSISVEHSLKQFNYCYPEDSLGRTFSFSDHPNKVFMIEFSASW